MPFPVERAGRLLSCMALALGAAPALYAQPPQSVGGDVFPEPNAVDRRPSAPLLDDIGYASILTGEPDGDTAIIAAHRSLPVPSYAEVTSLATGKTIVVRITAQGAYDKGRVIDLSCGAARQLGLSVMPAPIRVRRVTPPEQEQAVLNAGRAVAERLPSPPGLLSALRKKLTPAPRGRGGDGECGFAGSSAAPDTAYSAQPMPAPSRPSKPVAPEKRSMPIRRPFAVDLPAIPPPGPARPVKQKPVAPTPAPAPVAIAKGPGFALQVAALSSKAKATELARSIGGYVETTGGISRVRKGPYPTDAAARAALPQIRAKGFADARVITNEGH